MPIMPKSTPSLTYTCDRALAAGRSWDTLFLGLLSRVLHFSFVLPWHVVPKLLVQLPLLVSCKERLAALCPYPSLIYPALDRGMLFSSSKIDFFPPRDSSYTTGRCWHYNLGWQDEAHTAPGSPNWTGFAASRFHEEGKGADKQNRNLQCFLFLPILSVCVY